MRRTLVRSAKHGALWLTAALATGCHVLAGFSDLSLGSEETKAASDELPYGDVPKPAWSARFGDDSSQEAFSIARFPSTLESVADGALIGGAFRGTLAFGPSELSSRGGTDAFIAALSGDGEPLFTRSLGGTSLVRAEEDGDQRVTVVAFDTVAGLVIASGRFTKTLAVGGSRPLVAKGEAEETFLLALDEVGATRWSRTLGAGAELTGIGADSAGDIVIAGSFFGAMSLGTIVLESAGNRDVFVAKLDGAGEPRWARAFGDAYDQSAHGVAVDPQSDQIVLTGEFLSTLDFSDGTPLVATGSTHVFVAKLGPEGTPEWTRAFGPTVGNPALAIDDFGNVFLTGTFAQDVDLGGGPLALVGGVDIFLAKLDLGGQHLWSESFPGTLTPCDLVDCRETDLRVTTDGVSVVLTGTLYDKVDLGGGPLVSRGAEDVFTARFDKEGEPLWSQRFGDDKMQTHAGAACDREGSVLVAGSFEGAIDFGANSLLVSDGSHDVFVVKLDPEGIARKPSSGD